jgi:hypothetical protein
MITKSKIIKYFNISKYEIVDGLINTNSKYEIVDGLINTNSNVRLFREVLISQLPFQFGKVDGYFDCYKNQLTSLIGAPKSVGGYFSCSDNQLTSLIGAPISVGGYFSCSDNQLTSLIGAPKSVGGHFNCYNNLLTSLEGAPTIVGGTFYCTWSKDLPLLRLVNYKKVRVHYQVDKIINKYFGQKPLKQAILDCQKELIESGFVGNARW